MEHTEERELKTIYDSAISFYNKAKILINKNTIILKSYNTLILSYNVKNKKVEFLTNNKNHFTQTTNRHINEFLKQFTNENAKSKKELLQLAKAI